MPKSSTVPSWRQSHDATLAGFSVIEFLVALAITAILTGLGAVGFSGVTGRTRVSGEASDLLHAIVLTRSEAAKRGVRVTILPVSDDWAAGWTIFADTNSNRQVDPGESVILIHARMKPSTRVHTNTTPGYIAFGPTSMPQQYSGAFLAATIGFCDTGTARTVVLAKSGRPRIAAGSC